MKAIPDPCQQDTVIVANCSAVVIVIDYGDLRQRIIAAREKDWRLRLGPGRDLILCAGDLDTPTAVDEWLLGESAK